MIKRFLIAIYCCLVSIVSFCQQTDEATVDTTITMAEDSIIIFTDAIPRIISEDTANVLRSDKDFAYMQYVDSVFRNKKPPVEKAPEKKEESKSIFTNEGLRMLYWLIAITAVTLLLIKMFVGKNALFSTNKKARKIITAEADDKKESAEDGITIGEAIETGNYRLATRLLYLQTLKHLGEKQYLLIAPQKTNYQYLLELNSGAIREKFAELTLHYEYTWFGNFQPSAKQFETIHAGFENFTNSIG